MSDKKVTRRSLLGMAAAAGGSSAIAAALGETNVRNSNVEVGDMALGKAHNVAGDLWIGPGTAVASKPYDVDPNTGRVYKASDTQVEYYADGSTWIKMGVGSSSESVPSINTERAEIEQQPTGPADTEVGDNAGLQTTVAPSVSVYQHQAEPFKKIEHQDGSTLYAVSQDTTGNVYKSTDLGQTWSNQGSVGSEIEQLYKVKATGTLLAVDTSANIHRSTDDGATWAQSSTVLSYTPLDQGYTETPSGYVLFGEYDSGSGSGDQTYNIYRSTDDGQTFSSVWSSDTSRAKDVNPGHVHCVVWDDVAGKVVALADYNYPDILVSSDEGATISVLDTADNQLFPNFVAPMFFSDHVGWAYDNNDSKASGYLARMERADFYGGNWSTDQIERIGQANAKAAYYNVEIKAGVYLQTFASEDINDVGVPNTEEVYIVYDEGAKMAGGFEHVPPSVAAGSADGHKIRPPTIPFDESLTKNTWLNLTTQGKPRPFSSMPVTLGRNNRLKQIDHGFASVPVVPNNTNVAFKDTTDATTGRVRMDGSDHLVVQNVNGNTMTMKATGTNFIFSENGNTMGVIDNDAVDFYQNLNMHTSPVSNVLRFDGMSVKSSPPSSPSKGDWYIDDGTNTGSANLAIRIYDGTAWVDQN